MNEALVFSSQSESVTKPCWSMLLTGATTPGPGPDLVVRGGEPKKRGWLFLVYKTRLRCPEETSERRGAPLVFGFKLRRT